MKREEVLKKSQMEKQDEGKEFLFSEGRKYGVLGMLIIFSFLSVYYLYTDRLSYVIPLLAVIFAYLTCESAAMFHYSKSKIKLLQTFVGLIIFLYCLTFAII